MTGPAVLAIAGLALAAGIAAWGIVTLAGALWDAVRAAVRAHRDARRLLADATADAARDARCTWCRPADSDPVAIPDDCRCTRDCRSVACLYELKAEGFLT